MDHLPGTLLLVGAFVLSGAVATVVWSLVQIALETSERRRGGSRPRPAVTRTLHARRALAAGACCAAVLAWPVLAEATWAVSSAL